MHSNPAPRVDDKPTKVTAAPSDLADDPVRRLLGGPSDPVRHLDPRYWPGILGLVAAVAVAAFGMPPLITSAAPPAPRGAAAPLPSTPSVPARPGPTPAAAPSGPAAAVTEAPPTPGAPRTTPPPVRTR